MGRLVSAIVERSPSRRSQQVWPAGPHAIPNLLTRQPHSLFWVHPRQLLEERHQPAAGVEVAVVEFLTELLQVRLSAGRQRRLVQGPGQPHRNGLHTVQHCTGAVASVFTLSPLA